MPKIKDEAVQEIDLLCKENANKCKYLTELLNDMTDFVEKYNEFNNEFKK